MPGILRVALVDDEPLSLDYLSQIVGSADSVEIVGRYRNGREALAGMRDGHVDLLFLDIQMPGLTGFDVVARLQADVMPLVVFATAHDEYAIKAFEMNAVDYILKPFDAARVLESIERARERSRARLAQHGDAEGDSSASLKLEALRARDALGGRAADGIALDERAGADEPARLAIKDGQSTLLVEFAAIDWIDAAGDYMCVHAAGDTHILRSTMKDLESRMPSFFARIHRSTIVNLDRIVAIETLPKGESMLRLRDGTSLKVSRNFNERLKGMVRRSTLSQ